MWHIMPHSLCRYTKATFGLTFQTNRKTHIAYQQKDEPNTQFYPYGYTWPWPIPYYVQRWNIYCNTLAFTEILW